MQRNAHPQNGRPAKRRFYERENGELRPYGLVHVVDKSDLYDLVDRLSAQYPDLQLEVKEINTGGRDMDYALSQGGLAGMPFWCVDFSIIGTDAGIGCSRRALQRHIRQKPSARISFINRLRVEKTGGDEPHSECYPYCWEYSLCCLRRAYLERMGLLLERDDPDAAPDCLLLCEAISGLAMPVPLRMYMSWRITDCFIEFCTFYQCRRPISDGADYADMNREFDPQVLSKEAQVGERYIADLIAIASSPDYQYDRDAMRELFAKCRRDIAAIRRE